MTNYGLARFQSKRMVEVLRQEAAELYYDQIGRTRMCGGFGLTALVIVVMGV